MRSHGNRVCRSQWARDVEVYGGGTVLVRELPRALGTPHVIYASIAEKGRQCGGKIIRAGLFSFHTLSRYTRLAPLLRVLANGSRRVVASSRVFQTSLGRVAGYWQPTLLVSAAFTRLPAIHCGLSFFIVMFEGSIAALYIEVQRIEDQPQRLRMWSQLDISVRSCLGSRRLITSAFLQV